jgi:hypothetical protein
LSSSMHFSQMATRLAQLPAPDCDDLGADWFPDRPGTRF